VGILAGNGTYPNILAKSLLSHGHQVVIAGIRGQFSNIYPNEISSVSVFPIGSIRKTTQFFINNRVKNIYFAGGVSRRGVWRHLRPDHYAICSLPHALFKGDNKLLETVANTFCKLGVEVCDPKPFITELFAKHGLLAGPEPDKETLINIEIATCAARNLGLNDAGQSAIAYKNNVAGLEDRNGTNALIANAPGPGSVLAKVVKPGQDLRFDMPAIGPSTALLANAVGIKAIAVETDGVLLLNSKQMFNICNRKRISLVGI